ncbi:MAG: thioredoxin family protein [Pseudomonadota bacterium]
MIFKEFSGLARLVATAAILACAAAPAAAKPGSELRFADDLSALAGEARAQRAPLMIVFTQASCIHCEIAKRDYLGPMNRSEELRGKVIIREIDVDSRARLRDFSGQTVSRKEFSLRYRVRSVPTVVVMDDRGNPLASPVVGLLADDFYRLYLQQAIDEGQTKMQAARK